MIKNNKRNIHYRIALSALCFVFACIALLGIIYPLTVRAEETQYSNVLEDLQSDNNFKKSDYDNKLQHPNTELIQIAESADKQLFLYVHFVGDIKPVSMVVLNIETTFEKIDFESYAVECVSEKDNFCKYLVKDFTALSGTHTYSITRLDYPVDKPIVGTQEQTYDYIAVNQYWTVSYVGDNATYTCEYLSTLSITDKIVKGHFEAQFDGLGYPENTWTLFYIAFSTEIDMDNLLEVQIEYQKRKASYQSGAVFGDPYPEKPINVVVSADETAEYSKDLMDSFLFFSWKYGEQHFKFSKISTPAEFTKNSGISVPKRDDKSEFDWVVTFLDEHKHWDSGLILDYETPANTTILRLKYVKDGVTYNVGVLDTRTTYHTPAPEKGFWGRLWDWLQEHWEIVVIAIIVLIVAIPLAPFLPTILSGFAWVLNAVAIFLLWLLKGLWWLFCLPFKAIIALVRKFTHKGGANDTDSIR